MEKKNGEIELFRYIFASCVLCYHLYFDYFKSGWIGVEFFFIVSGILLARSVSKQKISKNDAPDFYFNFIKNKILVFYPYYFVIQVFHLIYVIIINDLTGMDVLKKCLAIIPNLLLIEYSGLSSVGMYYFGSWFLSCLILSLCLLLPLLLKNYKWSANITFPLIGILGLGFIYKNYGTIFVIDQRIFDTIYAGILRGISEIAIGVWGGEIANKIKNIRFTILAQVILTIIKYTCFSVVIFYAIFINGYSFTHIVFIICLFACILSFSEKTYNVPYNKITELLGKISLPLYISHPFVNMIFGKQEHLIINVILCNVTAIFFMFFVKGILSKMNNIPLFIEKGK